MTDMTDLKLAKETALRAAKEAGKILREKFKSPETLPDKPLGETLTKADLLAEEKILNTIKESFPEHSVLSEEKGFQRKGSEYIWVIDPLDGTTNFSIRNPFFNTTIALAKNSEVILAVTHAPMTDEFFLAEKGKGSFLNGERIHVSKENDISKLLLAFCNGKEERDKIEIAEIFTRIKPIAKDFDRFKSGALELAFVAAGRLGAYMANNNTAWDSAAGALLVKEAGGRVTDFSGNDWNTESRDILATNGKIHDKLLEIIQSIRMKK